jgi:NAD(P)H dehydrogenase (quinone)
VLGIDGGARIGAATRADMAAATTAALLDEGTAGATFELSGPPITLAGLAEAVTDVTGTKVAYRDVTPEELTAILRGTGLDDGTAGFVVALEESVARGDLDVRGDDLERLLGRPATTLADALHADHR